MNKKKITVMIAIVLIVVFSSLLTACDSTSGTITAIFEDFEYEEPNYEMQTLSAIKDLTFNTFNSQFIVFKDILDDDSFDYTYTAYGIKSQKILYQGSFKPELSTIDNMFYVVNSEEKTTSYYTDQGLLVKDNSTSVSSTNGTYYLSNGDTIAKNFKGETVLSSSSDKLIYYASSSAVNVNDYYVQILGSAKYHIFDTDGKYLKSIDLANDIGHGEESAIINVLFDNTIIIQIMKALPSDSTDYDLYVEENKISLKTYTYDIEKDKLKEQKKFNYIIGKNYGDENSKHLYLLVSKINDDKTLSEPILQCFDKDLKVDVDIQKLLKGATSIEVLPYAEVAVTNGVSTAIYNVKTKLTEYPNSSRIRANSGYFVSGNNFYDILGERVFTLTGDQELYYSGATKGIIYFTETQADESGIEKTVLKAYQSGDIKVVSEENYYLYNDLLIEEDDDNTYAITDMYSLNYLGSISSTVKPVIVPINDGYLVMATNTQGEATYHLIIDKNS